MLFYYGYSRCKCGAITISTSAGSYSCLAKDVKKYFPRLDLRRISRYMPTYSCDHCVNHFGLDLCGCGSGEQFGHCEAGLPECELPMQELGGYTRIRGADAIGA